MWILFHFIKYENYLHTYKMNMLTYFKDFKVVWRFDISVNKTSSMLFRVLILCFNNCQYQDAIFHKYIVQNIRVCLGVWQNNICPSQNSFAKCLNFSIIYFKKWSPNLIIFWYKWSIKIEKYKKPIFSVNKLCIYKDEIPFPVQ